MKIGELAQTAGTGVETVRFYEREGLLPAPPRSSGNYRVYSSEHVDRLAFIRHCRSLDMTLDEIRVLLRFQDAPHEDCGEINALLDSHIGHVARRIRELRALERDLMQLRGQCGRSREAKDCGILEGLTKTAQQVPRPNGRDKRHFDDSHGHGKDRRS
ncbi:MAG: Cd(II)/Pb(II)-responsive transcriptional regulator [Aquincola sp.]|nr:Cd(II)/Pb(II)-responsive transcriptional regulator [Aquincola sp.]|tara:strand:+ start:2740 stop:3213 length:474 start_codon:yes stop_codon:yes gene_type:complete